VTTLRMGELFAGYGGLGMGVADVLDVELAWVSEFDKGPSKILEHRFPGVPNHGDITKIDWSQVEPVDVLTGGSPCQDLSHAGRRAGMTEGTRSNLWVAMREAIAALRPSLVVWENVRGAYSAEATSALEFCAGCMGEGRLDAGPVLRALGRVLGDLSDLGYDAIWHGLRAADVGAPHGRFRVFVVAYPAGRHVFDGAIRKAGSRGHRDQHDVRVLPTPTTRDHKDHTIRREPHRPDDTDTLARALTDVPCALLPTPTAVTRERTEAEIENRRATRKNGLNLDEVRLSEWGDYAAAITRWEHVLGRPAPAPTQTSAKGNPQLSPRFTEWMMGLPDGWITDVPGITRNEALKACGNGVVPQQAAAALRWMLSRVEVAA
jgi:DNA (cytosine-5)-methyltransferase 1